MSRTTFSGPVKSDNGFEGDITGNVTGNLTGNVTGDITGNVTGNLTGNVTGNLTGTVTGSLTGTASAVSGVVNASILVLPTSTNALLGDKTKAVNTTGKTAGTTVYNTDTKTIYVASAPGVTDKWYDTSDGTTSITPA